MCPTGLCFTPHANVKKFIDSFGESQAGEALGIEIDLSEKMSSFSPTPSSLLRISPVAYFYAKHSYSKRVEIIEDYIKRLFGKHISIDVYVAYIELLINALNGLAKENILKSIQLKSNSNDLMNKIFFDLIDLITNDNNNIEQGIQYALSKQQVRKDESKYLNPYDSDVTIILTLYLQISGAMYNALPEHWLKQIYAKETIQSLTQWMIYQRNENLRQI